MKTVVIDPRRIGIGSQADMLLQVRPGSDGALASALIHCLMEESWYDASFVRQWTNGPFLLNSETEKVVTEADLTTQGSPDRWVVWDELHDQYVVYDAASGTYDRDGVQPALFGARILKAKDGREISCKPVFERLGEIAAAFAPERSEKITWVPADKVWKTALLLAHNRPVSMYMWNGVGQHTNATQTSRAIATLYALLGDFDRQGGNVTFPKLAISDVSGKEFLPREMAARRIGREEQTSRPPCQARQLCSLRYLYGGTRTASLSGKSDTELRLQYNHVHGRLKQRASGLLRSRTRCGGRAFYDSDRRALRLCAARYQLSRDGQSGRELRASISGQISSAIPPCRRFASGGAPLRYVDCV